MNDKLYQALQDYGIPPPPEHKRPNATGFIHWGKGTGTGKRDRYWLKEILNANDPGWSFGDWVDSVSEFCFEKAYKKLSKEEKLARTLAMKKAKQEADKLLAEKRKKATKEARQEYDKAQQDTAKHSYWLKKGIEAVAGVRKTARGELLVPIYNADEFMSALIIYKNGDKINYPGAPTKGGYFIIGDKTCPEKIICEGIATGASIYEKHKQAGKQRAVVVAFYAGNMKDAAVNCKQQYPNDNFVVAGDNDKSGAGKKAAVKAATAINCRYVIACFDGVDSKALQAFIDDNEGKQPTDYNDLASLGGDIVSQIEQATEPTTIEKLASIKPTENAFTDLMQILGAVCLFHNNGGVYAKIKKTVTPIKSTSFNEWLTATYCNMHQEKKHITNDRLNCAIKTCNETTLQHGKEESIYKRIAGVDGDLYINLKNKDRQLVKIEKGGSFEVIDNTGEVNFKEIRSAKAMALPSKTGDFNLLRKYINCNDDSWELIKGFILACFMDKPPYPILVLCGGAGTGKTTLTKLLKRIIDPNSAETVGTKKDLRNIPPMTNNNHLLCIDNNSFINDELSDLLCRVAYGEQDSERRLHTNDEQVIYEYGLPMVINGINNNISRSDLLDRSIVVELQKLNNSQDEIDLYANFEINRPGIMTGLFTLLAHGKARRDQTAPRAGYRYTHMVRWIEACTNSDRFAKVYQHNIQESQEILLHDDPLGGVLLEWIELLKSEGKHEWNGTMTELLKELSVFTIGKPSVSEIPKAPNALSRELTRLIKPLEQCGIRYTNGHNGTNRLIKLDWATITNDKITINNDTLTIPSLIKKPIENNRLIV